MSLSTPIITTDLEKDRPPAGTPCCVCRAQGHWCQADRYTAGDSGNGICDDCAEQRDCSVARVKRQATRDDPFLIPRTSNKERDENRRHLIEHLLKEGKTVRQIAHEEGISEHTILDVRGNISAEDLPKPRMGPVPGATGKLAEKAAAREMLASGKSIRETAAAVGINKNTVLAVKNIENGRSSPASSSQLPNVAAIGDRLSRLELGETITLVVPYGFTTKSFKEKIAGLLEGSERKWYMHADSSGAKLIITSEPAVGKVSRARIVGPDPVPAPVPVATSGYEIFDRPKRGRKAGATYKTEKRTRAMELLGKGGSLRDVSEATGLAKNTVLSVRTTIPDALLPEPVMGNASHKSDYTAQIGRLLQAEESEVIKLTAPSGLSLNIFADELMDHLCAHPKAGQFRWKLSTDHGIKRVICKRVPPVDDPDPEPEETSLITAEPDTTVPATVAPKPSLTISRAFELVIAEYDKGIAVMSEDFADDGEAMKTVEKMKTVVEDLRDSHPAVAQVSWTTSANFSVYELARKQAEGELAVIKSELGRLGKRQKALEDILSVLKKHEYTEMDTR